MDCIIDYNCIINICVLLVYVSIKAHNLIVSNRVWQTDSILSKVSSENHFSIKLRESQFLDGAYQQLILVTSPN